MIPEHLAQKILQAAINEGRSAELLDCLFGGGAVTLDGVTGKLQMVSMSGLDQLSG